MAIIRIGDNLDSQSLDARRPLAPTADNLAKRLFNPELPDRDVHEFYISGSPVSLMSTTDPAVTACADIGEYESELCGKLLSSVRKILCITGSVGSGKSTTARFIAHRLRARSCGDCATEQRCRRQRLISLLDFNKEDFTINDETTVKTLLLDYLCERLQAILVTNDLSAEEDELIAFWDEQFTLIKNGDTLSSAFVWLANRALPSALVSDQSLIKKKEVRRALLAELQTKRSLFLDYLVRYWGFVIRRYYNGEHGCAFLIFDNVDRASPAAQSALLSILEACRRDDGPTFLVMLRPETFIRIGFNTFVLDAIEHQGPSPSAIVLNRLARFANNPDSYYIPAEQLSQRDFETIKSYLLRLHAQLSAEGPDRSLYLTFLNKACGRSLRVALMAAQRVVKLPERDLNSADVNEHVLIRATVIQGQEQYREKSTSVIANLFHVAGSNEGRYLVKPRLLRLLLQSAGGSRSLNEVRFWLKPFGYSETGLIRLAVNECLNIYCQLIRSDGFDRYDDAREFFNAGTQHVTITVIGKGYATHLLTLTDYVQEVMLDCHMEPERLGTSLSVSYLPDKLHLLRKFLLALVEADRSETGRFIHELGKEDYFEHFGNALIAQTIVEAIDRSVRAIIASQQGRVRPFEWDRYQTIWSDYEELVLRAATANHDVLGIWPQYADSPRVL